jgi:dienelactone hydrolase
MKMVPLLLIGLAATATSLSRVKTETVEYKQGDVTLQGILSYDSSVKGKRPAVLIVHDWTGVSDYMKMRAERLAGLGYVALAADIYGKGVRPKDAKEASAEAGRFYKDPALYRARTQAGYDFLARLPQTDQSRIAVIGYCFGGAGALDLAASGVPLKGVVTFHGSLSMLTPEEAKKIKAKVLILHGADDPYVKQSDVQKFMEMMRNAGTDWELIQYGGAVHGFTDKRSGDDNSKGLAYNASADRRSWQAMRDFFNEIFARSSGK